MVAVYAAMSNFRYCKTSTQFIIAIAVYAVNKSGIGLNSASLIRPNAFQWLKDQGHIQTSYKASGFISCLLDKGSTIKTLLLFCFNSKTPCVIALTCSWLFLFMTEHLFKISIEFTDF